MPRLERKTAFEMVLAHDKRCGKEMDTKRSRQLKMLRRIGGLTHLQNRCHVLDTNYALWKQ